MAAFTCPLATGSRSGLPALPHAPTARALIATLAGTPRLSPVPPAAAGSAAQASPTASPGSPSLGTGPWQGPGHPAVPHGTCPSALPPPRGHRRDGTRTGQGRRQGWWCQERDSRLRQPSGCQRGSVPTTGVPSTGVGARGIPAVPGGAAGRRPPAQTLNGGAGARPALPLRAGGALPGRENPPPCQPNAGCGTPAAQSPPRAAGETEAGP